MIRLLNYNHQKFQCTPVLHSFFNKMYDLDHSIKLCLKSRKKTCSWVYQNSTFEIRNNSYWWFHFKSLWNEGINSANQPLALRRTVAKWRFYIFAYLFVNLSKLAAYEMNSLKLNYHKKVFYFALNFLPWEILLIKKLDFEKTEATKYATFKTDIIKVVLVFSISNFFTNKNSQGRKLSAV